MVLRCGAAIASLFEETPAGITMTTRIRPHGHIIVVVVILLAFATILGFALKKNYQKAHNFVEAPTR